MKLKVSLFLMLLVLSTSMTCAKDKTVTVKWKDIRKTVTKKPDKVKGLVARFCAENFDTKMSLKERTLAYYGNALLVNTAAAEALSDEAWLLFADNQFSESLAKARESLDVNPMNPEALCVAAYAVGKLVEAGDSSATLIAEGRKYYDRFTLILATIASTGDGSREHPFVVVEVSDEYNLMRNFFNLWEVKSQQLVDGKYDMIELSAGNRYYQSNVIFFDVTHHIEKSGK